MCEVNIYDAFGNHICKQDHPLRFKDKAVDIELNITKNMLDMIRENQEKQLQEDVNMGAIEEQKQQEDKKSSSSSSSFSSSDKEPAQTKIPQPVVYPGSSAEDQRKIQEARQQALANVSESFDRIDINGDGEVSR